MNNQLIRIIPLLLAVVWTPPGLAFPRYADLVVIGDSLSDQGNLALITGGLIPPPEYTDGTNFGRLTNGLNYSDYLSSALGLTVTPSLAGGSNYATAGARTDFASVGGFPIGSYSLLDQRDSYVDSLDPSGADPATLHVVWGGSNDLNDIIEAVVADPDFDPFPDVANAIDNIADIVGSLAAVNAKDILIPNVPNFGLVPLVTGGGAPVAEATALSVSFNIGLAAALDELAILFPDTNLIEFDVFNLLTAAFLNPNAFGFTNVTEACYTVFGLPGGTTCHNPDEYLSWDGYHPTTATHQILADGIERTVSEPAMLLLISIGLAGFGLLQRKIKS